MLPIVSHMYGLISFVNRGKTRKIVLRSLLKPMTPTELANKMKTHRPAISRALIELEKRGLVKCLTPKERMGRYYEISETGKNVLNKINEDNLQNVY